MGLDTQSAEQPWAQGGFGARRGDLSGRCGKTENVEAIVVWLAQGQGCLERVEIIGKKN